MDLCPNPLYLLYSLLCVNQNRHDFLYRLRHQKWSHSSYLFLNEALFPSHVLIRRKSKHPLVGSSTPKLFKHPGVCSKGSQAVTPKWLLSESSTALTSTRLPKSGRGRENLTRSNLALKMPEAVLPTNPWALTFMKVSRTACSFPVWFTSLPAPSQ